MTNFPFSRDTSISRNDNFPIFFLVQRKKTCLDDKIKGVGIRPGILYVLCKVHKAITDICPLFRPILSAIGTPSYKLAKFLVSKLSSITFNEFTVKNSFALAEEIVHQNSKLYMGSLDVHSLFTNIPLEETINNLYQLAL